MRRERFELNSEQIYLDAKVAGIEEKLEDELYAFAGLLQAHYDFKLFLEDPRIAANYKKDTLKKLCPPDMTTNFFAAVYRLIDNGREELVEQLSREITRRIFLDKGILFGEVTSVSEIPKEMQDKLVKVMERIERRPVRLRYGLNPELLGGISVRLVNGEVWDASLRHKLEHLKADILK